MANTKIEWCDKVWNPVTGCTHSGSPGCDNCYAKRMAIRLRGRFGYPGHRPFQVIFHYDKLYQPLKWRKPSRIFVCSMGDLFHQNVSIDFINGVFAVMAMAYWHTFIILTKRPERMLDYFTAIEEEGDLPGSQYHWAVREEISDLEIEEFSLSDEAWGIFEDPVRVDFPLKNVQIGVSISNQPDADRMIPELIKIEAKTRIVSIEPMLGAVDLNSVPVWTLPPGNDCVFCYGKGHEFIDAGELSGYDLRSPCRCKTRNYIDGVILGGETGSGARTMNPDWVRQVRDQCQEAGVPFFMKQMARKEPIPDDLMIREYPNGKTM